MSSKNFYKVKPSDHVYWFDDVDQIGVYEFSFDKKRIFNLFKDYPHALTSEEKHIFDSENPYWADFFKDKNNTTIRLISIRQFFMLN